MQPAAVTNQLGTPYRGFPPMLERRMKGKGKMTLVGKIPAKGRKPAPKFQKKLVVMKYMGSDAPQNFTLKGDHVLLRGMLPEISIDASEREIRSQIRDTITDSSTLSGCLVNDFEFLEATGKSLCVPAQQADFEWSGRAVKELAGSGSIYVRMTTDLELGDLSNLSDYLASSPDSSSKEPDIKIIKVECPGKSSTLVTSEAHSAYRSMSLC